MHWAKRLSLVSLAVLFLVPAAESLAQASAPDTEELVALQKLTRREFTDLTDKMVEVADLLADTDPEAARAIRQAVSQAQAAFLAERMDEVAEHLARGMDAAAARGGEEIISDLRRLLETLLYGGGDLGERAERIRRWRETIEQIDRMLERQRELERTSHVADSREEIDRRLREMGRELEGIVSEQEQLLKETEELGEPDSSVRRLSELRGRLRRLAAMQRSLRDDCETADVNRLPIAAGAQRELAEAAGSLAEDIRRAAGDEELSERIASAGGEAGAMDESAGHVETAAGEMETARDALSRSEAEQADLAQEQTLADLAAAERALSDALDALSSETDAGRLAERQSDLVERTDTLSGEIESLAEEADVEPTPGDLSAAADQMRKAAEKLTEGDSEQAAAHERRALRELSDRRYELAQLHRRIEEKAQTPTEAQAGDQSELADHARSTADQMSQADDDRSTPGGSGVDGAADSMDQAAGKLGGGDSGGANVDQNEAIDRLERARQELAEAIAREQEMLQAEQLASIAQMLQQVLTTQEGVSSATKEVHAAIGDDGPTRGQRLRLVELSDTEGGLADDISKVTDLLSEEGATVVFPGVLEEVHEELGQVQSRLAKMDAGHGTQRRQTGIEADLRAMLDAIREEISRRRRQGGGGGGNGGGGDGPLIPPLAELKMLRLLQLRIQSHTEQLVEAAADGEASLDELAERYEALAERQRRLRRMTAEVAERMEGMPGCGGVCPAGGGQ